MKCALALPLSLLIACGRVAAPERPGPILPGKVFYGQQQGDGSLLVHGHWKLVQHEGPDGPPFAAQPVNSTILRIWPARRLAEEYRAHVFGGILFPLEPMRFDLATQSADVIEGRWKAAAEVECILRVNTGSQEAFLEYHREPTPGRSRVFERWVLE